jgi:hypothetical protein
MAQDFELSFSADILGKLSGGEISAEQFLNQVFEDQQNHANLCQSLAAYFYDEGGSPEVQEFDIAQATFNVDNLTGAFKCNFKVYYFFTCSDIKNDKHENITWKFKIDAPHLNIAFVGEEPWVRDAD